MTTTNTTAAQLDWHDFVPTLSVLPLELHREVFETAPSGSVVEVWRELYKRGDSGDWVDLETLTVGDGFHENAPAHRETDPDSLRIYASHKNALVRVLRVGVTKV